MSALAWSMMAIAVWHFTVYLPDKFWGGIIGAFFSALVGSVVLSFVINGFDVPGRTETGIEQAFIAIPGTLIGLAICYWYGSLNELEDEDA